MGCTCPAAWFLSLVVVILGDICSERSCPGGSFPRWNLSRGSCLGVVVLGGSYFGRQLFRA